MLLLGVFLLILVLTFVIVLLLTRPSRADSALEQRLAQLSNPAASAGEELDIRRRVNYSELPVLDWILQNISLSQYLHRLIMQADMSWSVGRVLLTCLLLATFGGWMAGFWMRSYMVGAVVAVAGAIAPVVFLHVKRGARFRAFNQLLPDAIDLMSRALRAGHAVTASLEMVGREVANPVGMEFRRTFEEQNFGLPLRDALISLTERVPISDLKFLVTAILVQKETGGNLAEVLDKTAAVIRERARLLGQLRIYTAQGRMSGWILGLLPFVVFGLMNIVNPGYARVLVEDPGGQKAIWIGLGLMLIGAWLIRKIVDIKV